MQFSRLSLLLVAVASSLASRAGAEDRPLDFNRDIRPILSNNCYKCHGFDDKERKGELRLDTADGFTKPAESGAPAIVPGKHAESELYKRLTSTDADVKMPPPESGKTLSAEQIELIKKWIDQGGKWTLHWSFLSPQRAEAPAVKHEANVGGPIDRFVLARLEQQGLNPSPLADKTTLLRRVTLDLTGMPPTLAEIDAFLADNDPNAYEKVVNRLLESPRYGEHQARYWLDAVRYGDTHGLHLDNERSMWLYREWVINALNQNKPFDKFTLEQMAGDLLPEATKDQKIATGYLRCNVTTGEGGSIDEEVLVRYNVDRVEALGTVFLGLTTGCAVCHNHKFDPLTQREFYQLYAFFNGIAENAMDGNALAPPPMMKVLTADVEAKQKTMDDQVEALRKQMADEMAKIQYTDPTPDGQVVAAPAHADYVWFDDDLPPGAQAQGTTPWKFVSKSEFAVHSGEKASTRTGEGITQHFFTAAAPPLKVGEGDRFFAHVYLDPKNPPKCVMLQFNDGSWEHRAFWGEDVISFGTGTGVNHLPMGPLPETGKWVRLEVEATKVGLAPGAVLNGWAFTQFGGTTYWDKAGSVTRTPQAGQSFESLAAWNAFVRTQTNAGLPAEVQAAVKVEPAQRNDAQKKQIRDYFIENVYAKSQPVLAPLRQQIADMVKQRLDLENTVPTTMVAAEMAKARDTFMLVRGAYDKKADKVEAAVPSFLPPLPAGAPANRLGLAQWLIDPQHPLTARVTVNRYWQQFFGRGIVKTAEDFGTQGEWPSHPELLDWLATEFIRTGWDVKAMHKLIVMSNTYRQSSKVSPELLAKDPENVSLARGPRFRMDAEMIRDSALASSGLLIERVGGRSVKPYQPEGIWEAVGFLGSNTRDFKQDAGEALYRRSLYTFWKRTAPPPSFVTFDAPSRETCTVRRARTNTPLQALVLLNDKQYVEAARQLAERMITTGTTPPARAAAGFRLATGRLPNDAETAVLVKLYQDQLIEYQANKDAAVKFLSVGETKRNEALDPAEHAAWTLVANVILNLDETVTKE
jgi:hypothetical protein